MQISIAGGGVGGLAAALVLGRAGHEVVVVERDAAHPFDRDPLDWHRPGVPQYLQPHVLLALGCRELSAHAPDVYAELLAEGAAEIDMSHPGVPHDPELRSMCFRRGLLERALRRAVAGQPNVTVHYGATVLGSVANGLDTSIGMVTGDLVIDALGRGSALQDQAGRSQSCGMVYYSRYYRLRDDNPNRPGNAPIPVRLDLGFGAAYLFWADNRHAALIITVPTGDRELQQVRDEDAFTRAVALIPSLTPYIGPDAADPVTSVRPMGNLQSSLREPTPGIVTIGDAMCHTNPWYGWGMSLALAQACALPSLISAHDDVSAAFWKQESPRALDRYEAAAAMDDLNTRHWSGEKLEFLGPQAHPSLFRTRGLGIAGLARPDIQQRQWRWIGVLDPSAVIDSDVELREEASAVARAVLASLVPPVLPDRDVLMAAVYG